MSYDLICGSSDTDWSRGAAACPPHAPGLLTKTAPSDSMGRHRGRRMRYLRSLSVRAARGDASAQAKLQQIRARLAVKSAAGDARATNLLQQIQQWQTQYQGTTTSPYPTTYPPTYPSTYTGPGMAPQAPPSIASPPVPTTAPASAYYPAAPAAYAPGSADDYDDDSGMGAFVGRAHYFNDEELEAACCGNSSDREALARIRR